MVNCFNGEHLACTSTPLTCATVAEKAKQAKYGATARYHGQHMFAAAMETTGAFGKTMSFMLHQAQRNWSARNRDRPFSCSLPRWSAKEFHLYWGKRIAVAAVNMLAESAQQIRYGPQWQRIVAARARRTRTESTVGTTPVIPTTPAQARTVTTARGSTVSSAAAPAAGSSAPASPPATPTHTPVTALLVATASSVPHTATAATLATDVAPASSTANN
jgi:hypothetical protein